MGSVCTSRRSPSCVGPPRVGPSWSRPRPAISRTPSVHCGLESSCPRLGAAVLGAAAVALLLGRALRPLKRLASSAAGDRPAPPIRAASADEARRTPAGAPQQRRRAQPAPSAGQDDSSPQCTEGVLEITAGRGRDHDGPPEAGRAARRAARRTDRIPITSLGASRMPSIPRGDGAGFASAVAREARDRGTEGAGHGPTRGDGSSTSTLASVPPSGNWGGGGPSAARGHERAPAAQPRRRAVVGSCPGMTEMTSPARSRRRRPSETTASRIESAAAIAARLQNARARHNLF